MSMYIEADKLKEQFKTFSEEQLNIVIRFGQVAKFRCRSNAAYRNFVQACFKDVAVIEEEVIQNNENNYVKIRAKKGGDKNE